MLWNPKHDLPAETKVEPWRQVLRDAANVIVERGHAKHELQNREGGVCLFGSINVTTKGNAYGAGTADGLLAANKLIAHLGLTPEDAIDWNNAPERTKEEVISALRAASES